MLPLELRPEFRTKHMRGTAIELRNRQNSGWAQRDPSELLRITYPTVDVQRSLEAVSRATLGKPIVLLGQRGRGKSHILALLHHAFESPDAVEQWAREWGNKLGSARLSGLALQRGLLPISETLSNQEYPHLWDVIFERHPRGLYYRGKFEQAGTAVPAKSLLQDMFSERHAALIFDEFQTWFDGLHDSADPTEPKPRQWAFNFIQILSELAKDRPDLLVFIVSVRDTGTEAFRQIHRDGPILVDFKGEGAKEDRKKLLLHRLFENRGTFAPAEIEQAVATYAAERNRLLFADRNDEEKARLAREVAACWPFSPELLNLLDEHILMAAAAQETRDLIRILAEVYRARGGQAPLLAPSDFFVDDADGGVTSLIDSFTTADQEHLREKAQRNLEAIQAAGVAAPRAREVISGIWMRSLAPSNVLGATRQELQLDITRAAPVDDNAFTVELATIFDNSSNIHQVGAQEKRYCLRLPENPLTKLKAWAKNDRHFDAETAAAPGLLSVGRDQVFLRSVLDHLLRSPDSPAEQPARAIVLDPNWEQAPWANLSQDEQPERWERPALLVLPVAPADPALVLGPWLARHVRVNRNMVRFLLPKAGLPSIYDDRNLLLTARCAMLAKEWKETDPQYTDLFRRFDRQLRKEELADRFDRYALLSRWDYQNPPACVFHLEAHGASGSDIPARVEKHIRENFFAPEDFEPFIVACARRGDTMKQVLALLREPPARPDSDAIPYLGDTILYEQVVRVAAQDKIALNVDGTWYRRQPGQSEEDAIRFLRQRTSRTGRELQNIQFGDPNQVGSGGLAVQPPAAPTLFPTATPPPAVVTATPGQGAVGPVAVATPAAVAVGGNGSAVAPQPVIRRSLGAKTGINLLGDLERWALRDGQRVLQATLTLQNVSIKDLRDLCTKLPPRLQAELQITLPPEGEPPA
jgi:hypothetical protein